MSFEDEPIDLKGTMQLANEGDSVSLCVRLAKKNNFQVIFYSEGFDGKLREDFNVILTTKEAKAFAMWLFDCADTAETNDHATEGMRNMRP